jgi:cytochrome b561
MLPTPVFAAVLAPLVVWRMVSRVRRLTTRQRSKTWRHRTTLVFFPILLLLLTAVSIKTNPFALAGLAAGLPVGAVLGRIAIGRTRFEQVGDDFFFTPHAPIGIAVALLFMARMAWRAYEFFALGSLAHHEFVSSPLTLVIFGVLAGYYMSYAFGLLSWRKRTAPVSP